MAVKDLAGALKLAEDRNLRFVSLQFTDIVGAVKSVTICHSATADLKAHTLNADVITASTEDSENFGSVYE